MDPITVPEDLTPLTDEQLAELGSLIAAAVAELAGGELSDEAVTEIERLGTEADRIDAVAAERETAAAELAERRDAALARFDTPADEADDGPGDDDQDDDESATDEPGPQPEVETEAETEDEPVAVAASAARPAGGSLARLGDRRPAARNGRPRRPSSFMFATNHVIGRNEGAPLDTPADVAEAIAARHRKLGHVPNGVREQMSIAVATKEFDGPALAQDAEQNFGTLEQVRQGHTALVASGGICAPQTPLYDFFRLAEPQSPVQQALPVVQAPRGGIRFIVPPDFRDARASIQVTTAAQDEAGYGDPEIVPPAEGSIPDGGAAFKACVTVVCPGSQVVFVSAVSRCVRFGNLGYRTFPEQVAAFMEDVAVAQESTKETFHLDFVHTNSTAVTSTPNYGVSRGLHHDLTAGAVAYRKRNGMRRGAQLQVFLPDWVLDLVKVDMANDGDEGLSYLSIPDAQVVQVFTSLGLSPVWYNDSATAAPEQLFAEAQAAGALNAFPNDIESYLFAPGTFVRLDGGTLDVGLVRDSTLNKTNDLELFAEEWIATAMLGLESIRLTSTVCPNGAGAGLTAPVACV